MTTDQHIKLVAVGDKFYEKLGDLAAGCIAEFPCSIQDEVIRYLQDKCSIYSTTYTEKLKKLRLLGRDVPE